MMPELNGLQLADPDIRFINQLKEPILQKMSDPGFGVKDIAHHTGSAFQFCAESCAP